MFDAKLNYESRFFISGQELSGIDSIDISYSQQTNVIKPLGYSKGATSIEGASKNTISISRSLIYQDPLLNYTGDINASGSIHYENSSYGFKSGYMTDYLVNCAVGSIPKVTVNFDVFDHLINGSSALGSIAHPEIHIPNQGSMSITCDNTSSNRVVGFDYSIKKTTKPIYTIGSTLPAKVEFISPLDYSATVQIEIDDAFMKDSSTFFSGVEGKSISLSIKGRDNVVIQNLTIPKASLISEQLSASADGILKLTLTYNGHS
jgi:hypothetical protein